MVVVRLRILKDFRYGSISDPDRMIAGNVVDVAVSEKRLEKWIEMRWVEKVD